MILSRVIINLYINRIIRLNPSRIRIKLYSALPILTAHTASSGISRRSRPNLQRRADILAATVRAVTRVLFPTSLVILGGKN